VNVPVPLGVNTPALVKFGDPVHVPVPPDVGEKPVNGVATGWLHKVTSFPANVFGSGFTVTGTKPVPTQPSLSVTCTVYVVVEAGLAVGVADEAFESEAVGVQL